MTTLQTTGSEYTVSSAVENGAMAGGDACKNFRNYPH